MAQSVRWCTTSKNLEGAASAAVHCTAPYHDRPVAARSDCNSLPFAGGDTLSSFGPNQVSVRESHPCHCMPRAVIWRREALGSKVVDLFRIILASIVDYTTIIRNKEE